MAGVSVGVAGAAGLVVIMEAYNSVYPGPSGMLAGSLADTMCAPTTPAADAAVAIVGMAVVSAGSIRAAAVVGMCHDCDENICLYQRELNMYRWCDARVANKRRGVLPQQRCASAAFALADANTVIAECILGVALMWPGSFYCHWLWMAKRRLRPGEAGAAIMVAGVRLGVARS